MGWLQLAVVVLQFSIKIFDMWADRNRERKAKKKKALEVAKDGIKRRDPTRITSAFAELNRLR